MKIDISLKECESNIDKSYQTIQNKVNELKSTLYENEKNHEVYNKDYISIIPRRYCIFKTKDDKINSITIFGDLNDSHISASIPAYDLYLENGDSVIAVIFCKYSIKNIIKKIINSSNKDKLFMIQIENNFIYKLDSKNLDTDHVYKKMIIIPSAIKVYAAYFNKFKSRKQIIYSVITNDYIEEIICKDIFDYCGFIDSKKAEIANKQNDLTVIFSNDFSNNSKKEVFTSLDSNSILSISSCSNKFQLDPPDIQYLNKMNITLNFFEIESFLNNMLSLGSCVNFIDDLLGKIKIKQLDCNKIQIEVQDLLLKLKEIGNGSNLKQLKNDVSVSNEETIIISFMNIVNSQNSDLENNILLLY